MFDRLLAEGSDIHCAVLSNNETAVKEILKDKADVNILDKGGRTALHSAACYNSPIIQTLLSVPGISVNVSDVVLKWTPLRYAKRTKSWMVMNSLLENGGNTEDIVFTKSEIKDKELGQASLWECARNGYVTLLNFMMNCGINVNAAIDIPGNRREKCTLLEMTSEYGQVQVVRFLLDRKAKTHKLLARHRYKTPLRLAAASSGCVEVMKLLLERGMSANLTDRNGNTPLHISTKHGNMEATKFLVERGAELDEINKHQSTPLMVAAIWKNLNIFRYLTEMGADINRRGALQYTVLHLAAFSGSVDIIQLLLQAGMSVNLIDKHGNNVTYIS